MKKYSEYIIIIVLINIILLPLISLVLRLFNPMAIIIFLILILLLVWGMISCFIKIAINIISDGIKLSKKDDNKRKNTESS